MAIAILLIFYCICVAAASLAGGALPVMLKITHRRMQLVMSFVGGLMLGVALLHLLPHSLAEQGSIGLEASPDGTRVFWNGSDVSGQIRQPDISL